jgi:hypothetical protein
MLFGEKKNLYVWEENNVELEVSKAGSDSVCVFICLKVMNL